LTQNGIRGYGDNQGVRIRGNQISQTQEGKWQREDIPNSTLETNKCHFQERHASFTENTRDVHFHFPPAISSKYLFILRQA